MLALGSIFGNFQNHLLMRNNMPNHRSDKGWAFKKATIISKKKKVKIIRDNHALLIWSQRTKEQFPDFICMPQWLKNSLGIKGISIKLQQSHATNNIYSFLQTALWLNFPPRCTLNSNQEIVPPRRCAPLGKASWLWSSGNCPSNCLSACNDVEGYEVGCQFQTHTKKYSIYVQFTDLIFIFDVCCRLIKLIFS